MRQSHSNILTSFVRAGSGLLASLSIVFSAQTALSQANEAPSTLFQNVRVFDGTADALTDPVNVLVRDGLIERITTEPIPTEGDGSIFVLEGDGRTLMPGLIDAHVHIVMSTIPIGVMMTADPNYVMLRAAAAAEDMLMRGFTRSAISVVRPLD
jgi:imidazolonepropionase-like amidohydrolase